MKQYKVKQDFLWYFEGDILNEDILTEHPNWLIYCDLIKDLTPKQDSKPKDKIELPFKDITLTTKSSYVRPKRKR